MTTLPAGPVTDDAIRACVLMTYCFLCGYAKGDTAAGGSGWVRPETLRDLEQTLIHLGMTPEEVAQARDHALGAAPDAGKT